MPNNPTNGGRSSHVLRVRHTMDMCAAHQPHPGQGATYEGVSLWLKFTNYSERIVSAQASALQIRTCRSKRKRGQWEPIIHAQRASVAIWKTAAMDHICGRTQGQQGTSKKGSQSETRSTSALHPGKGSTTTGHEGCSSR